VMLHRLTRIVVGVLLAVGLVASAQAHQQKAAVTSVTWNPRSGMIEIVHRFYLHDAEHAMQMLHSPGANIVADEDVQQAFAEYVAERFTMTPVGADSIAARLVGFELERAYIFVYEEAPYTPDDLNQLSVGFSALHDIWPDQSNLVNIEIGPCVKTVIFDGSVMTSEVNTTSEGCKSP